MRLRRWATGRKRLPGLRRRTAHCEAAVRWTSWIPIPASARWKTCWAGSPTASTARAAMKIWRICRECYASDAFSGEGARRFGGRWNSRGVPMVYASTSLALAAIELFVHLEPNLAPVDLVSIAAELPEGEPALRWDAELPENWWSDELAPMRELGDRWIREKQSLA